MLSPSPAFNRRLYDEERPTLQSSAFICRQPNSSIFLTEQSASRRDTLCTQSNYRLSNESTLCWIQEELTSSGGKLEDGETNATIKRKEKGAFIKPQHVGVHGKDTVNINHHRLQASHLVSSLKTSARRKDIHGGTKVHADILQAGLLDKNVYIGSSLVNMYAKCGALEKAQELFEELPCRDQVSWNALIAGYAQQEGGHVAMDLFEQMQGQGYPPNAVTFICVLKACANMKALDKGRELHAQVLKECLLEEHVALTNALIHMYSKCDALEEAQEIFDDGLPIRDIVSWNTLIAGYVQQELFEKALSSFVDMKLHGFSPDVVTLTCILKACGGVKNQIMGEEIHGQIRRENLLKKDTHIGTALVDMFVKCGTLEKAREVFDELPVRDAVSWNALIAGYAQIGKSEEALEYYARMHAEGFSPSEGTYVCILKACGSLRDLIKGREIHDQVAKEYSLEDDYLVTTALVDMYAKCGMLLEAQEAFDELPSRNEVSWNALMSGYAQHELSEEAWRCFEKMQFEGVCPDAITFLCLVRSCGSIGAAYRGQRLHSQVVRCYLIENGLVIGNALVDLYANCGMIGEAQEVFNKLPSRKVVSWSSLMAGYAQLGMDAIVSELFGKMIGEGIQPDEITLTIVLNACSHNGQVDKGELWLEAISKSHGVLPNLEHYGCTVDLFGRTGRMSETLAVVRDMPICANLRLWRTFLGACQRWGNLELGRWAFEHAIECDEKHDAAYVCLSSM